MIGQFVQLIFQMQKIGKKCLDNTFGEGFSWEDVPWFDANGLNDVAPDASKDSCRGAENVAR